MTASAEGYLDTSSGIVEVVAGETTPVNLELVASGADATPPTITHEEVTSVEEGWDVTITAEVTDNEEVIEVGLFYRVTGADEFTPVDMVAGSPYSGTIPGDSVTPDGVEYYIGATDGVWTTVDPETAPDELHSITVSASAAPTITHTAVTSSNANEAVTISADVTDATQVSSVKLFYRVKGTTSFTSVDMAADGDTYSATIPANSVSNVGVEYYIETSDSKLTSSSPADAPTSLHTVTVTDSTAPTITHTPVTTGDVGTATTITAGVIDNVGVSAVILHYKLPGETTFTEAAMNLSGSYSGTIPASLATTPGVTVQYYISASDGAGNTALDPTTAPTTTHTITIQDTSLTMLN